MSRWRGFSLIEVLVVIAVLAILTSILIPALRRVREKARETLCQSNLRTLAQGIEMYASDNNGFMPINSDSPAEATNKIWNGTRQAPNGLGILYPGYLEDLSVFFCPGADYYREESQYGAGNWGTPSDVLSSYLYRGRCAGAHEKIDENRSRAIVMDYCDIANMIYNHFFGMPVQIVYGDGHIVSLNDSESTRLHFSGPSAEEFERIFLEADELRSR